MNYGLDNDETINRIINFINKIPYFKSRDATVDINCNCVYVKIKNAPTSSYYYIDVRHDFFYIGYKTANTIFTLKIINYNINTIDFLITNKDFHFGILKFYYIIKKCINEKLNLSGYSHSNDFIINCEYNNITKKVYYDRVCREYI